MSDFNEMLKEGPTLTFEPFKEEKQEPAPQAVQETTIAEEAQLSDAEKKMVDQFASQIDLNNSQMVMQYGAGAQKKIADFSESALENVRTKDLGETGKLLAEVVNELKDFDAEEEEKGIFGFFKKVPSKIDSMKARYSKAETNVERICTVLNDHQVQLLKDSAMLDQMYELNKNYYKELTMYIAAGKKKLDQVKKQELPALITKAQQSGSQEDMNAVNDLTALCDRFEKKVHDLELTRMVAMQMAPQIRMIQNNDILMSEKIQSMIVNTVPLWKSQMVLALGVAHSKQAAEAQREVTDMTNALLRKNAETLKMASVETAQALERGVVDIETLTATNELLISTIDEVAKIHEDGRAKRIEAQAQLQKMENDLRNKLLEVSTGRR
ncbi:MAG TPA: toxic anion resistance protein [Candidatus Scybalocola faecigallinarum]|uniref:Toxic anion resistance protein n=1 Tax=Candidatus Scybalocola faecigallinarum TaxID=2840941 RepID=A0A9D1F783_9FIRM|nr:toxic anion resistance protein [Candidatus Scybalocola faecigallinarum]